MNGFPSREIVESIRKQYPAGTRVELVKMDDPQAPPIGTLGTVEGVDGIGDLLMRWDTGSGLKVAYGEDVVRIVSKPKLMSTSDEEELSYGCDGENEKCKGCVPYSKIHWLTSSFGLCDCCYEALHRNLTDDEITDLYEAQDSGDNSAAEKLSECTRDTV